MPIKHSPQNAINKIRSLLLNDGGYFEVSGHCRRESMPKRDIDDLDIGRLLTKTGNVTGQPDWNEEHQNYVYKVEGKDALGDDLTGIVTIDEVNKEIFVITVY